MKMPGMRLEVIDTATSQPYTCRANSGEMDGILKDELDMHGFDFVKFSRKFHFPHSQYIGNDIGTLDFIYISHRPVNKQGLTRH